MSDVVHTRLQRRQTRRLLDKAVQQRQALRRALKLGVLGAFQLSAQRSNILWMEAEVVDCEGDCLAG